MRLPPAPHGCRLPPGLVIKTLAPTISAAGEIARGREHAVILLLIFLALAALVNYGLGPRWRDILRRAVAPGLKLGAVGFAAGFFGPMLLKPDANQGPMLGIFITGPAGFLLGLGYGVVRVLRDPASS